jgi:hypothetical protein
MVVLNKKPESSNQCRVCRHVDRVQVDREIINRVPLRELAQLYHLGVTSLHRHRHSHMQEALRRAAQRSGYNEGTLLERLRTLSNATIRVLSDALNSKDRSNALGAVKTARDNLLFEGELLGKLRTSHGSSVRLSVVYGQQSHPEDGNTCSRCGQVLDWEVQQNKYNRGARRALGLCDGEETGEESTKWNKPQQGETALRGTGLPAGVDFEPESQPAQVVAEVVRPIPPAITPRALPAHREPEANLLVVRNASSFDWSKL